MLKVLKSFFSSTLIIYLIIGSITILLFDFSQARVQRVFELTRYIKPWFTYYGQGQLRLDEVDRVQIRSALKYYKLLYKAYPQKVRAKEMQGLCYSLLGDDQRAIRSYDELLIKRPHFFWIEFEKGMSLYRLGRWQEAKQIFHKITKIPGEDLLQAAALPSVQLLPGVPVEFVHSLEQFVYKIKTQSHKMIFLCEEQRHIDPVVLGFHPWTMFVPVATQPFQD